MKVQRLVVLFSLLLALAGCKSAGRVHNTPAQSSGARGAGASNVSSGFDFYLLNLSWSPEFCFSHRDAAECALHPGFVLHGLWPENADGTYSEHCSNAPGPSNPSSYNDLYPDPGLLSHEWETHGTCSGLDPDAFFTDARRAFHSIVIPPQFTQLSTQISLSPDQVLESFSAANPAVPSGSFLLSCGHNYLSAVEVCIDKGLHPITCPSAIHSCRARVIRVTPP
ncbi:MAG TPA: ribonuclease T2 [Terracidiphilus sp.]|nr:ribonuclease T2 [Terracidiphilus sp.]